MVHASPGDLWRAPTPETDDAALRDVYGDADASTVVYGHIHRPFVRVMPELTVANSGSAGMPYDGDPRACYLIVEDGVPSVRRVEYDVDDEVAGLSASGYPRASWLATVRRDGRFVPLT